MKLYHAPKAPNPERVVHFLRAKDRLDEVEIIEISIMNRDHKTPEYRAMSPFAHVPVLQLDDGDSITESRAICTYLEGLFPDPNLFGRTPLEKAQIEMWDRRVEFMWFFQFAIWFRNTHPMMAPLENPQSPEAAAKGEGNAKAFVKRLDAHLANTDFIAADRFSYADIIAFVACGFCAVMKWKPHEELAHLGAWRARVAAMGIAG
ncbi:MAG: glutathione S-transferase [Pseudomonadota bacterium]